MASVSKANAEQFNVQNKATEDMIGKTAYLFQVGGDPIQVIIDKIDAASGLIIEVIIIDENKEKKVIAVKDQIVMFLPWLVRIALVIASFFRKKD